MEADREFRAACASATWWQMRERLGRGNGSSTCGAEGTAQAGASMLP